MFLFVKRALFLSIAFFPASRSAVQEAGRESLRDGPKTHKSKPFLPATVANSGWPFIRNSTFDEGPPVLRTRELS